MERIRGIQEKYCFKKVSEEILSLSKNEQLTFANYIDDGQLIYIVRDVTNVEDVAISVVLRDVSKETERCLYKGPQVVPGIKAVFSASFLHLPEKNSILVPFVCKEKSLLRLHSISLGGGDPCLWGDAQFCPNSAVRRIKRYDDTIFIVDMNSNQIHVYDLEGGIKEIVTTPYNCPSDIAFLSPTTWLIYFHGTQPYNCDKGLQTGNGFFCLYDKRSKNFKPSPDCSAFMVQASVPVWLATATDGIFLCHEDRIVKFDSDFQRIFELSFKNDQTSRSIMPACNKDCITLSENKGNKIYLYRFK